MQFNFGELTSAQFLSDYWQKKPLLLRQALPDFESPLSVDEVAGLALEPEVESRLIWEKHPGTAAPWALEHGPFTEQHLQALPEMGWSLLVQGVDQWIPEVAEFRQLFAWMPQWRFEDIMISIAPPSGSVGPHVDQYDVFLCQVSGQRQWQWSKRNPQTLCYRDDTALSILAQALPEPTETALLNPGDVLYLPPGFAHHGIAQTLSQTWSVGYRAPDAADMLRVLAQRVSLEPNADALRYADPDLTLREGTPHEISAQAIVRVQTLLNDCLQRPELIADVLGPLVTQHSLQQQEWEFEHAQTLPHPTTLLTWNLNTRRAYFGTTLYINGVCYDLTEAEKPLLQGLMQLTTRPWQELQELAHSDDGIDLLTRLWEQQILQPADSNE